MANAWAILSMEPKEPRGVLNDKFVMRFDRMLDWNLLSTHYDFSLDMLRMYQHRVNWAAVLKRTRFPETFLREMVVNFNGCWATISKYQNLSEAFINDFSDSVDWEYIALYQHVSSKFLTDNAHRLAPEEGRIYE